MELTDELVEKINNLIEQAIYHGGYCEGPYYVNTIDLTKALREFMCALGISPAEYDIFYIDGLDNLIDMSGIEFIRGNLIGYTPKIRRKVPE